MIRVHSRVRQALKRSIDTPLRGALSVGYHSVTAGQLLWHRIHDEITTTQLTESESRSLSLVTGVIKTFERRRKLSTLLNSSRRLYPSLKLIVVDDSEDPLRHGDLDGVRVVTNAYDSGVSKGRSDGLALVDTPYFLNLDDDFVFCAATNLTRAIDYLERNPAVDLVAAQVPYLPYYIRHNYFADTLISYDRAPLIPKGTVIDGLAVHEKCSNCFVARTEKVRQLGWIEALKRLDHADFFTRAHGVLVCVEDPHFQVLHQPSKFDRHYLQHRRDFRSDSEYLMQAYKQ